MPNGSIGAHLKALRLDRGLTQEEVGKRVLVSKQTLYKYENDIVTNIPVDKIELLAEVYHVTPAYIMGWEETHAQHPRLSAREVEVLRLLVLGKTAKEIGKELYISEHTVTSHRKNIAEKLGIKTIPGMTIYAVSAHLIEMSDLKRLQEENGEE